MKVPTGCYTTITSTLINTKQNSINWRKNWKLDTKLTGNDQEKLIYKRWLNFQTKQGEKVASAAPSGRSATQEDSPKIHPWRSTAQEKEGEKGAKRGQRLFLSSLFTNVIIIRIIRIIGVIIKITTIMIRRMKVWSGAEGGSKGRWSRTARGKKGEEREKGERER